MRHQAKALRVAKTRGVGVDRPTRKVCGQEKNGERGRGRGDREKVVVGGKEQENNEDMHTVHVGGR